MRNVCSLEDIDETRGGRQPSVDVSLVRRRVSGPGEEGVLEPVGRLLDRALRALGEAGEADAACRLAAEGWWLLRGPAPRSARRLNATLHYLTVHPGRSTEPQTHDSKEAR